MDLQGDRIRSNLYSVNRTSYFTAFVLVVYFILRTYGIVQYLPSFWFVPLLTISFIAIRLVIRKRDGLLFLMGRSKWIILSLLIVATYGLCGYGNFKLYVTFAYLVSSIPFYIVGFYSGMNRNNNLVYSVTAVYYSFISLFLLPKTLFVLFQNSFDSGLFVSLFVNNKDDHDIIFFLPFVAFISIYGGFVLLKSSKKYKRLLALIFGIFNMLALFMAAKAGAFAVILSAVIIYYYKNQKSVFLKLRNTVISVSLVLLFFIVVNSGLLGELGTLKKKSEGVVMLLENGVTLNTEVLNILTSDRWTAGLHSLGQFVRKPIFGNGAYLDDVLLGKGGSKTLHTAAGGHSFILDTLAYYGVFGIPLIVVLISFIKTSNSYAKVLVADTVDKKEALVFASLMASMVVVNLLNTGFLFSYFDNYLFLLAGFYLGKYYSIVC